MKGLLKKPKLIVTFVTLILLASAVAVPLASSLGHSHASSGDLRVFEHTKQVTFIKVDSPNPPRGNYVVFYDPVFDATDTHQIGSVSGICTVVSSTVQECHITFLLEKGEIAVQGPELLSGAASTLVITGGTGIYTGAQGSVTDFQKKTPAGVEFASVFHFA